jgi:FkbM family methyltransferase
VDFAEIKKFLVSGGDGVVATARRFAARWLPAPAKRAIRRLVPARFLGTTPATRSFSLALPTAPADLGPVSRDGAAPRSLRIEAPRRFYVPGVLEVDGLAGYEPETMAAFLAGLTVREARVAFDVGANMGLFSLVAAALTTTRVVGFEPTPDLAATFRSIATRNGLTCEIEPIALGARTGTATLYLSAWTDSSNSLQQGFRPATGTVEVSVERLDDHVARTGRVPAVLKIDTETTEPDVLAGGISLLREVRPWLICEVLAGETEERLMTILGPLGYEMHHLGPDADHPPADRIVGDPIWCHRDWLFTPEPLPPAFAVHYAAWRDAIATAGA